MKDILVFIGLIGGYCLALCWFTYQKEKILEKVVVIQKCESDFKTKASTFIEREEPEATENSLWFHKIKTLYECDMPMELVGSMFSRPIYKCKFRIIYPKRQKHPKYQIMVFPMTQKCKFINKSMRGCGDNYPHHQERFIDSTKAERMFIKKQMDETRILLPDLDRLVSSYVL